MSSDSGSDSGDSSGVSDTGDTGSEADNNAATDSGAASVGAGDSGVSDTGDTGSEAGNVSATESGAASVGAGSPTDTGDLGSEQANIGATTSGAASVGVGTEDGITNYSYSPEEISEQQQAINQLSYDVGLIAPTDPSPPPTETIKSYVDNLKANVLAQPVRSVLSPTMTALKTAAQTVLATSMLNDARFSGEDTGSDGDGGGDGNAQTIDVEAVLPYYISDQEAVPSQALAFFRGLSDPNVNILSRYGQAKQNIQNVLGDASNQFGYGRPGQSNIFAGTLADIPASQAPVTTTDFFTGTLADIDTDTSTPQTNNFFDNYLTEEGLI